MQCKVLKNFLKFCERDAIVALISDSKIPEMASGSWEIV